jgi:anti-sigma-K factor RskA
MTASGVPEPPPGRTYQLWLQQPGHEMVSAGLMPDPRDLAVLAVDASTATAAAVSVEPARGSPHPTTPPIAVFTLRAAHTGAGGT